MIEPIIMKARLLYKHKARIGKRHIIELILHQVPKSKDYSDGVKYRMICHNEKTGFHVLMDNHRPKGHHIHVGETERPYEFTSIDQLIADFKNIVFKIMGVKL